MEAGRASTTALVAAYRRAHHFANGAPWVFADPLASAIIGRDRERIEDVLIAAAARFFPDEVPRGAAREVAIARVLGVSYGQGLVLSRARYTEDRLAALMQRTGVSQYVLVGAGLDTFALRRPDLRDRLQIFELDHPATQTDKRRRLREAGLALPPTLHFGAADLERESVATVLTRLPYDPTRPALFAWLGVTMYLTRAAVLETLRSIRSVAAHGSEIVFDYFDAASLVAESQPPGLRMALELTRSQGEPIIFGFEPARVAADLESVGFEAVEDLGPPQQNERYFEVRTDGLRVPEFLHVACARVR
jgi:methyltransferase (TIGR00027 family)